MLKIHSTPRNLPANLTYLPKLQYYNQYYQEKVKIHNKPIKLPAILTYLPKLQYYNQYYQGKVKNSQ